MGAGDEKCQRRDEIVDSGVDTTMYKGLYLLQKEWSINHNEGIWCHNGVLSCTQTMEKRVGHMEHMWGYT